MHLSTFDLRQILDAVSILNSDHQPETLPRRTFDSVKLLIPTDVISYEAFGSDKFYQGPLWFEPTANVSQPMLEAMEHYVSDHPIFLRVDLPNMRSSRRVSDNVTLPQFKKTIIYNEFFRHLGTNRQLSSALHISAELSITCSLCRFGSDYTARDCAVLDLLTPHLVNAFQAAHFVNRLNQEAENFIEAVASGVLGIMTVGTDMALVSESASARKLMDKYYRDSYGARLPTEIAEYINHHLSVIADGDFCFPPLPLKKVSKDDGLIIKLVFQSGLGRIILLLEEFSLHPLLSVANFGVTPREYEVLEWVGCGKTDPEIAHLLKISVRTVHKHLENIFTKLGVETRTAAASFIGGTPKI